MSAIKDSNRRSAWGNDSLVDKINAPAVIHRHSAVVAALLSVIAFCSMLAGGKATASFTVPTKTIAQITIDDDGRAVDYPVAVFFDPVMEEIYLVNGGRGRVVVYGPDFFPRMSIGVGRGVFSPRGGTVLRNGEVYVCQIRTSKNPSTRITVLNGAFFVEREIFLDKIPSTGDFTPRQVAVSRDGIVYVAGDNYRGILVLDNEGNYLRLLQPTDQIILRTTEEAERLSALEEEQQKEKQLKEEQLLEVQPEQEQLFSGEAKEETPPEEDAFANIPEEFRPRTSKERILAGAEAIEGPVKVNSVTIDSTGKLYLISAETGKIYVYGPDESFLFSFGTKGGSPGQLSNPRGLAIDEKREVIYVSDYMRHTVLAYDMTGNFIFEVGGRGFGPGWFNFPNGVAINNKGQLIVADLFNKRVQVLEVSNEDIAYYKEAMSGESSSESSDALESTEQNERNEIAPGQSDGAGEQEIAPETPSEQPDGVMLEEDNDGIEIGRPDTMNDQENEATDPLGEPAPAGHTEGEGPDASE